MRRSLLICAIALSGFAGAAMATTSQVTVQIALSNAVLQPFNIGNRTGFVVNGSFLLPTFDPAQTRIESFSAALSLDVGGATWGAGAPGIDLSGAITWWMSTGPNCPCTQVLDGGASTNGWTSDIGFANWTAENSGELPRDAIPGIYQLYQAGSTGSGAYFPLSTRLFVDVYGALTNAPSPPYMAARLVFASEIYLTATYTLTDLSTNPDDRAALSGTPPTSHVFYHQYLPLGWTDVPGSLVAQLPTYLPMPVPEPNSGVLILAGLGTLLVLRKRSACKAL